MLLLKPNVHLLEIVGSRADDMAGCNMDMDIDLDSLEAGDDMDDSLIDDDNDNDSDNGAGDGGMEHRPGGFKTHASAYGQSTNALSSQHENVTAAWGYKLGHTVATYPSNQQVGQRHTRPVRREILQDGIRLGVRMHHGRR
jgi:hypothetical protein